MNNENPLSEYGVEGRVIVQFEIDTSGAAIDAHVVRGIYPVLDSIALNKVENMPKWTAALDYAKKPIACKSILPFTFKIDSNKP